MCGMRVSKQLILQTRLINVLEAIFKKRLQRNTGIKINDHCRQVPGKSITDSKDDISFGNHFCHK